MLPLVSGDPTSLSYWLNWRFLLCALWAVISVLTGLYLIWKYEFEERTQHGSLCYDKAWKPCLNKVRPVYLLIFRILAFCLLFVALSSDVAFHGFEIYYYYTEWAFTLVTIYFGLGSLLSIHGCFLQQKVCGSSSKFHSSKDMEQGVYMPLAPEVNGYSDKFHLLLSAGFWSYLFQILFQITAGAVTITDLTYWSWTLMFPLLSFKDYELNFKVVAHSLNAIMLLGDTALNSLQFPFFRVSYLLLLGSIYVIFQWIVHAAVSICWPYPLQDLSLDYAPLWLLIVALLQVPCYGIFALIIKVKHLLLSRWFPRSYRFYQ